MEGQAAAAWSKHQPAVRSAIERLKRLALRTASFPGGLGFSLLRRRASQKGCGQFGLRLSANQLGAGRGQSTGANVRLAASPCTWEAPLFSRAQGVGDESGAVDRVGPPQKTRAMRVPLVSRRPPAVRTWSAPTQKPLRPAGAWPPARHFWLPAGRGRPEAGSRQRACAAGSLGTRLQPRAQPARYFGFAGGLRGWEF